MKKKAVPADHLPVSNDQWLYALIGLHLIREKAYSDANAGDVFHEYFKTLDTESSEYHSWKYYLEKGGKIIDELHSILGYSDTLARSDVWKKIVPTNYRRRIAEAAKTYCPTSERERFFMALGGRGSYDCNSDDIPDGPLIGPDICAGVMTVCFNGVQLIVAPRSKAYVQMEITSWKGMSIGAEHYYVKLKMYYFQPNLKVLRLPFKKDPHDRFKVGELYGSGGYGDDVKPRICRMSNITVRRPLTRADIKETKARFNPDRYEGYKVGESWIDGFWTRESAAAYGTKVFNQIFDKNLVELKMDNDE